MECFGSGSTFEQLYKPSTEESIPPTIPKLTVAYKTNQYRGSFLNFVQQNLSQTQTTLIQNKTKQQSKSLLWHGQRIGAVTSATMHGAALYNWDCPDNYIVKLIMGESTFRGNACTQYGSGHEAIAKKYI